MKCFRVKVENVVKVPFLQLVGKIMEYVIGNLGGMNYPNVHVFTYILLYM